MKRWSKWPGLAALALALTLVPAQAQITLLGKRTNDAFLSAFWGQNNNASNLVQGLNANHGTNQLVEDLLPYRTSEIEVPDDGGLILESNLTTFTFSVNPTQALERVTVASGDLYRAPARFANTGGNQSLELTGHPFYNNSLIMGGYDGSSITNTNSWGLFGSGPGNGYSTDVADGEGAVFHFGSGVPRFKFLWSLSSIASSGATAIKAFEISPAGLSAPYGLFAGSLQLTGAVTAASGHTLWQGNSLYGAPIEMINIGGDTALLLRHWTGRALGQVWGGYDSDAIEGGPWYSSNSFGIFGTGPDNWYMTGEHTYEGAAFVAGAGVQRFNFLMNRPTIAYGWSEGIGGISLSVTKTNSQFPLGLESLSIVVTNGLTNLGTSKLAGPLIMPSVDATSLELDLAGAVITDMYPTNTSFALTWTSPVDGQVWAVRGTNSNPSTAITITIPWSLTDTGAVTSVSVPAGHSYSISWEQRNGVSWLRDSPQIDLGPALAAKAPIASPVFTGRVQSGDGLGVGVDPAGMKFGIVDSDSAHTFWMISQAAQTQPLNFMFLASRPAYSALADGDVLGRFDFNGMGSDWATNASIVAAHSGGTGTNGQLRLMSDSVALLANTVQIRGTNTINATVDVLVAGGTTNRLVWYSGSLVSNLTSYWPPP
jgi:hypothetical protein